MKLAIDTLNRYLKTSLSTDEVVELLNRTEIEVEEVICAPLLDKGIILSQIESIEDHPNADRLKIVIVDTGKLLARVVCGAPNVRVGMKVALVQPGTKLPDGATIKQSAIRGELSDGMLASGKELGLSDDHDGLLPLDHLTHNLGTSLCDILKKSDVLDIKTPANRWDYLSGVGVAREIAAYCDTSQLLVWPETQEREYEEKNVVEVIEPKTCQRILTAKLRVNNDVKTPSWIVDNLEANGFVSHNPVVDITNFVMLELGQPSHAYDAEKITTPLSVRFAHDDEQFTSLDGVKRSLTGEDVVVCDANSVLGLGGIIGGQASQISSQSREIVLEAAHWDKTTVRRSSLRHGLRTEASSRFERDLPLPLSRLAFDRLIDLMVEVCDAEVISGPNDQLMAWPWRRFLSVRLRRAETILGVSLEPKPVIEFLQKLGYEAEHFSLTQELRSHLGKPYVWGANFRQHGDTAFDCSYLVDRLYSKLGIRVGHTALGQLHHGWEVDTNSLKPGDVLFIEGKIEKSATDHYYSTADDGSKQKHTLEIPERVGHNGIYIGGGKVIHASQLERQGSEWVDRDKKGVIESDVAEFIDDAGYIGARRYIESFNHLITIAVPWWRTDVTQEADLIEDIGKGIGFDTVPSRLPRLKAMPASSQSLLPQQMDVRKRLVALGLTEVSTYSFISAEEARILGLQPEEVLAVANPRSPEQAYVRSTLLTSHARIWARQPAGIEGKPVVFEISKVFEPRGLVEQPLEHTHVGMSALSELGLSQLQSILHRLAQSDHIRIRLEPLDQSTVFVPQLSARIVLASGEELGMIGQVRSSVASQLGLSTSLAWCEVNLNLWLMNRPVSQKIVAAPDYQLVERDVSLELPESIWWQDIVGALDNQENLWKVHWLDSFQDSNLQGKKRHVLTFRLILDLGAQPSIDYIDKIKNSIITHIINAVGDPKTITIR